MAKRYTRKKTKQGMICYDTKENQFAPKSKCGLKTKTKKSKSKSKGKMTIRDVRKTHRGRSKRARKVDEGKKARRVIEKGDTEGYEKWAGNKNRYDVEGVDYIPGESAPQYRKGKTKKVKPTKAIRRKALKEGINTRTLGCKEAYNGKVGKTLMTCWGINKETGKNQFFYNKPVK